MTKLECRSDFNTELARVLQAVTTGGYQGGLRALADTPLPVMAQFCQMAGLTLEEVRRDIEENSDIYYAPTGESHE